MAVTYKRKVNKKKTNPEFCKKVRAVMERQLELKCHDQIPSGVRNVGITIPSTGLLISMTTLLGAGDNYDQRTGIAVTPHGFRLSYNINWEANGTPAAPTQANACRCIIFVAKEYSGADPAPAQVVRSVATQLDVPYQWQERKKFTILYDKTHAITYNVASVATNGQDLNQYKTIFIPKKKLPSKINYFAQTAAIANSLENQICVLWMTSASAAGSTLPSVCYESRLTFTDA